MRAALTVLLPLVEACEDEDFDRFMARSVKAMLLSKGFSSQQLEEAMTMSAVVTEFQRSWDEVRQEGVRGLSKGVSRDVNTGSSRGRWRWWFS